jgi:hypothetical protein
MAVSNTISTTSLDVVNVIEKAYRRCRVMPAKITAEMLQEARRTLFLRLSSLTNKGLQLWTLDEETQTLVAATAAYELATGTVDVMQVNYYYDSVETPMARIAQDAYTSLPDKTTSGRPSMYWLDRQRDVPVLRLYPVPDATYATGTLKIWRKRHIMDIGDFTNTVDMPQRWHEAGIWDLAAALAVETMDVDPSLAQLAKARADEEMLLAMRAETDASPLVIRPSIRSYTR